MIHIKDANRDRNKERHKFKKSGSGMLGSSVHEDVVEASAVAWILLLASIRPHDLADLTYQALLFRVTSVSVDVPVP